MNHMRRGRCPDRARTALLSAAAFITVGAPASAQSCPAGPTTSPTAATQATPPPPYTTIRYTEDYAYLKYPAKRTDFFDPIKYIPLNAEGDWYLSLGGQFRYRYEHFNNPQFGAGVNDEDGHHLIRFMAHADLHLGEHLRFFVQGKSSLIEDGGIGMNAGPRDSGADELDLQQAFGELRLPFEAKDHALFRLGRQEMTYGVSRVIATADWANARRAFDGGKGTLVTGPNQLDVFWVRPVDVEVEEFNNGSKTVSFAGLYNTLLLNDLIAPKDGSKLELYALALNRTEARFAQNAGSAPAMDEDRYTFGGRFSTKPKPFDFDVEGNYQTGQFGDGSVSAWMVAAEAGYTLDVPTAPRAILGIDVASGDRDPNDSDLQTYNQLFPTAHFFFGYLDTFGRPNLIDLHAGMEFTLLERARFAQRVTFRTDYHVLWRTTLQDGVYNGNGALLRGPGGSDDAFAGSILDFVLTWQVDRHLLMYAGYSYFFAGNFIQDTAGAAGNDEDVSFFYAAVQYTF